MMTRRPPESLSGTIKCVPCREYFVADVNKSVTKAGVALTNHPMKCPKCGIEIWPWDEPLEAYLNDPS